MTYPTIPFEFAVGALLIGAILILAAFGNIDGDTAMLAVLGVGSALGVSYRTRK